MKRSILLAALLAALIPIARGQISGAGNIGCSGTAVSGTVINSSTSNNTVVASLSNFQAWGVLVQLDQTSTITGGAVTFQESFDGGANYISVPVAQVLNVSTFVQLTNPYTLVASTNQSFLITLYGATNFQVKLTTAMTGTGAITPYITAICSAPQALVLDSSGNQKINIAAQALSKVLVTPDAVALPAGSAIIGKVGIDQTTPGTTNAVAETNFPTTVDTNTGNASASTVREAVATNNPAIANWGHGATNAAPPANGVLHMDVAATALPSPYTATDTAPPMVDKFGRQIVIPFAMRDLIKTAAVQTTNATQTTLLASQTSQYADLVSLTITNESATACTVALTDGTTTYKFNVANQQGAGFTLNPNTPIPATSTATAWQVTGCASVTLDYVAEFVLNK